MAPLGGAPPAGVTFSHARESNQRSALVVAKSAYSVSAYGENCVRSLAPPLPTKPEGRLCGDPFPLCTPLSDLETVSECFRRMGIGTGSPIGAAACVQLLARVVPTADAYVVRLKSGGGVGNRRFHGVRPLLPCLPPTGGKVAAEG